jgi:opacity protein-like surface antigen
MSSSFSLKVLTASLLLASTTGLALAADNKNEATYKGEAKAAPCPVPATLKDGIYVGVQGGFDAFGVRENIALPTTPAIAGNPTVNNSAWTGGLLLGYGKAIKKYFYLGAEIFGNISGVNANFRQTSNIGYYTSNMIARGSYGFSILPGIKLTNTSLAYLHLGYNWINLRSQENTSAAQPLNYASNRGTAHGFSYGLGAETLVYQDWSLRADYTYTNYSSSSSDLGTTFRPSDNRFMLGVLYHFG